MPFLILNDDNSISEILSEGTGIEVSDSDVLVIVKNRSGHAVFDYIGGDIVLNQARYDAQLLAVSKSKYINELIEAETKTMVRERLTAQIQAVENVTNQAALDALKT